MMSALSDGTPAFAAVVIIGYTSCKDHPSVSLLAVASSERYRRNVDTDTSVLNAKRGYVQPERRHVESTKELNDRNKRNMIMAPRLRFPKDACT
jgi:hypothetical protein